MSSLPSCKRRRRVLPAVMMMAVLGAAPLQAGEELGSTEPLDLLDVPYVPTPEVVVARMLEMAEITEGEFVIDLGSGDGRIVIAAARDSGARALGVDLNRDLLARARANAEAAGVSDRVTFREQDLFETDLSRADVLTMFLTSSVNLRLRPRILKEMRPGARVVSHLFRMGDWEPDQQDRLLRRGVYFWVVPARVAGRWRVEGPDRSFTLELTQNFQNIEGTATVDGESVALTDTHLKGAEIRFVLESDGSRLVFAGVVEGDRMRARSDADAAAGAVVDWRATRQ